MRASLPQMKLILTTTEQVGAKVPAEVTAAIARAEKIHEKTGLIYVGGDALVRATLAALDADRDPAADPDVQRIIASHAAGQEGITGPVRALAIDQAQATLAGNVDAFIDVWQKPFNAAAQTIADTAQKLGNVDLLDAQAVLRRGADAAEQWTLATTAVRTIDDILGAWVQLATHTGFAHTSNRYRVLRYAAPTLEQWERLELEERKLSAWEAHHLGLTLELATREQHTERQTALATAREKRDQTNRDAYRGKVKMLG